MSLQPQINSNLNNDIRILSSYYLTQPISDKYVIFRKFIPGSEDRDYSHETNILERQIQPTFRGAFKILVERHGQIIACVEKLLLLFVSKFNMPQQMKRLSAHRNVVTRPTPPLIRIGNALSTIPVQTACKLQVVLSFSSFVTLFKSLQVHLE
jgi:hypothetical protein